MSLRTGQPATALIDTPPEIFDRMVALVVEQQQREAEEEAKAKLQARLKGRR